MQIIYLNRYDLLFKNKIYRERMNTRHFHLPLSPIFFLYQTYFWMWRKSNIAFQHLSSTKTKQNNEQGFTHFNILKTFPNK